MTIDATMPLRIARPTTSLAAAERYWIGGVGLEEQWRSDPAVNGHALLMVGPAGAAWHLELVEDPQAAAAAQPGEEDLLVLYLGQDPPRPLIERILAHGGRRVTARNPYWERWGVTFEDPDGYRLVLSQRRWDR